MDREDLELATPGWDHWHYTSRRHRYLADVPPTEFEAAFYDAERARPTQVTIQ